MTPRALRNAAETVIGSQDHPSGWGGMICDAKRIARYILATEREDDDEPVTTEWLVEVVPGEPDYESDCFMVVADISICKIGDIEKYGWEVWCHEYELGSVKTRGQLRKLCEGLGIVLEEKAE